MGKQKRRRRGERRSSPPRNDERQIEEMIVLASEAFRAKDVDLFDQAIALLEHGPPNPASDGPRLVDDLISSSLGLAVSRTWRNGWQPTDIVSAARRSVGRTAAALSVDVIAADMPNYPAATVQPYWREQLSDLDATVWWSDDDSHLMQWSRRSSLARVEMLRVAVKLLSLLHHLPRLPLLCPIPGEPDMTVPGPAAEWGAPQTTSPPELARVRALLTKAESTTFPEEAEALTAKAQELMAIHSIDRIALAAGRDDRRPIGRRLGVENPYAGAKSLLLDKVAVANRCRSVWTPDLGFSTVFGDESDVASVDILFTSLLTQATAALQIADRGRIAAGGGRARSFRHSFHVAYATRIGARLAEVMAASEVAAEAGLGADLLPVLASHADDVEEAVHAAFPGVTSRATSVSNRAGWSSGIAAADMASLTTRHEVDDIASA
ncbi:MAG: DUF2786 domain-containing protein [Actinomycetota bacterium]|nr:DUF2786 domain-containing protein [Actinomycetota bacterium]